MSALLEPLYRYLSHPRNQCFDAFSLYSQMCRTLHQLEKPLTTHTDSQMRSCIAMLLSEGHRDKPGAGARTLLRFKYTLDHSETLFKVSQDSESATFQRRKKATSHLPAATVSGADESAWKMKSSAILSVRAVQPKIIRR